VIKKLFVGSLTAILFLSMALQASPVLAQGSGSGPDQISRALVQARITNVVLLKTNPPKIRITGTLPSSCYQARVSAPRVGSPDFSGPATPITINVYAVRTRGQIVCSQALERFTKTVTLDPARLNLAPGSYRVRVNPQSQPGRFQVILRVGK
jgi:hypothetical protein